MTEGIPYAHGGHSILLMPYTINAMVWLVMTPVHGMADMSDQGDQIPNVCIL